MEEQGKEQLEKEKELRDKFSDILSVLSLTLNDSIKWKKEHDRVSLYLEIRNKELEDYYKDIHDIRKDIEKVLIRIDGFIFNNKKLVNNLNILDVLLNDINKILDKHKPYITFDEKEKQEKEKKKNCSSC